MGNAILSFPNYIDAAYYTVNLMGGSWQTSLPLTNLKDRLVTNVARSTDALVASTKFHVNLGAPRPITNLAIPRHSLDRFGKYKIRGTNTAKWGAVTVNGAHLTGATSVSVKAGTAGATIAAEDFLTYPGDATVYKVTVGATLGSGATGSITISPGLATDKANGLAVVAEVGDYTTPVKLIDWKDVWGPTFPWGTILFESDSGWSGQVSGELASGTPTFVMPIVEAFGAVSCRYWLFEFDNVNNPLGYIDLGRLFMSSGWQPTLNIDYGFATGYEAETGVDTSMGGARWYDVKEGRRVARFTISMLQVLEAFSSPFEMQRQLGKHKQIMFIFDPDDTTLKAQRTWLATMRVLSPMEYPSYDRNSVPFEIEEVIQ